MKRADLITGALLFVVAAYITHTAYGLTLWTTGRDSAPGPGFVPFVAGLSVMILSVALIIRALLSKETVNEKIFTKEKLKPLIIIGGGALGASLLVDYLGFILSMGLMGGFLTFALSEKRNWIHIAAITVIIPIAFHFIFTVGLSARLPVGIFGI